jgi:hypothetical protein
MRSAPIIRPRPPHIPVSEHRYATCIVREQPRPVGPDVYASSLW